MTFHHAALLIHPLGFVLKPKTDVVHMIASCIILSELKCISVKSPYFKMSLCFYEVLCTHNEDNIAWSTCFSLAWLYRLCFNHYINSRYNPCIHKHCEQIITHKMTAHRATGIIDLCGGSIFRQAGVTIYGVWYKQFVCQIRGSGDKQAQTLRARHQYLWP